MSIWCWGRATRGALCLGLLVLLACDKTAGVPPTTSPEGTPAKDAAVGALSLAQVQGRWRIESSSGKASDGHVFAPYVGSVVSIDGNIFRLEGGEAGLADVEKTIAVLPKTTPQAIDLTHDMTVSKGWSRIGICRLEGDALTLSLNFPQGPRPVDFEKAGTMDDEGREVVALRRLRM